jgi:hypothetical protein
MNVLMNDRIDEPSSVFSSTRSQQYPNPVPGYGCGSGWCAFLMTNVSASVQSRDTPHLGATRAAKPGLVSGLIRGRAWQRAVGRPGEASDVGMLMVRRAISLSVLRHAWYAELILCVRVEHALVRFDASAEGGWRVVLRRVVALTHASC